MKSKIDINVTRDVLVDIAKGDEKAFRIFYESYFQLVAQRIYQIIKNKEQTEEILQDIFSKIWFKRESVTEIENIEGFLYTMARNACLNQLKVNVRKDALQKRYIQEQQLTTEMQQVDTTNDYYNWLDEAIQHLPGQQKKVYILSRINHKKYKEIADELQISKETVKKYLQIANKSIEKHLIKYKNTIALFFYIIFKE